MKDRTWARSTGRKVFVISLTIAMFVASIPLTQSNDIPDNAILAPRTLDRYDDPVVVVGNQIPDYIGYANANVFVWAWNGGWQQVPFQIDEANGTWPFDNVHKRFGSDNNPGIIDADDEICFMASDTGDQVSAGLWAPGADTGIPRIEITAHDPNTGRMGWAYLFHHTTPPAWTSTSYVAWDEGTNFLTADNYTMDYPDNDAHNAYFHDARVTPTGGGDNGQFIDREKMYSAWRFLFITNRICEQTWYTWWSGTDDDGRTSENSLTVGPVRIIRHWRMAFNPSQATEWGEKKSFQVFYYRSHLNKLEHGKFWGSTTHLDDRNSIDHVSTTPDPQYWDSHGNTATVDGSTSGDSITVTTPLDWYQVSSPHGSYIQTSDFSASTSPVMSMEYIDNSGAADNDGGRSGADPGKYGDISMDRMDLPSGATLWDNDYHLYFLPANAPLQGADYFLNASNPISTSDFPPVTQVRIGDPFPPATVGGSVLIEGLASYTVPVSAAGIVHLTSTVDDTGLGDGNISVANWTIGFANLPGTIMDPVDGAYDNVAEDVEDTIDISTWGAGTYDLYVYGVDDTGNQNTTSTEHATLIISDDLSPATVPGTVLADGLAFYSSPLSTASPIDLTAAIDDSGRGDSDIISAVWTNGFTNFPGMGMTASDGTFDSITEDVIATIPVQTWDAGLYDLYVYGTDAIPLQNTTSTEHATVQLIDDLAPEVQNVLAEGLPVYTVALSDAFFATITATVSDDTTGGSIVGGANMTMGQDNWPSSIPMIEDTPLDTDIESFSYQLDISSWLPGTYYVYVYGWDDVPNYNTTSLAFATIIITNDASPEIKNVLLDGVTTLNVPFSSRGTVTLTGTVDDWSHGDLVIGGANYTLGMANWPSSMPMTPVDVLDTPYENFTADIDISTWPVGTYDFYMYGWDVANDYNASSLEYARLIIYDDVAPIIEDVLVEGLVLYETTLSAAGVVTLTAAVNDTGTGASVIGGANYTVGEQDWPGTTMAPDTALDSPLETFSQPIDLSAWLPGVYDVYVYGWDSVPNYNRYSTEHVTIVIHDDLAPEIRNVLVNGSASHTVGVTQATDVVLTATIDDTGHGNTVIGGANYTLGFVNWPTSQAMTPVDGAFDSPAEDVTATVDISSWLPGTYDFYVYGWDVTPIYNITSTAHGTLTITDDEPPAIYNFLVDGVKSITADLDDNGTFTGIVSDEGRGDSIIANGFFTDEYQVWNVSYFMTNDTALDSANESFTEVISFDAWTATTHMLFMYGIDVQGHANDTSTENVTVTIIDNKAPVTVDWSATLNGAFQVWVDPAVTPIVILNATVTDEFFGFSNISSANWTVGPANWSAGHAMSVTDGSWDNFTEDVTAIIDVTGWPSGTYEIYVYGTDVFNNGQVATATFCRLHVDADPPETIGPWADGLNPYIWLVDDSFQLTAYGDDRNSGNSIITGAEYFVDSVGADGTGTPMSPIGFRFDSPYEGAKALVDLSGWSLGEYHTYFVHFIDDKGHWGECESVLVMREIDYGIPVHAGWNLISVPLVTPTNDLDDILVDLDGYWEYAMTYESNNWISNSIHRPAAANDFNVVDNTIALWVYLNDADDGFLNVTGALPGPTAIDLYAGWNFVGYPTLNTTTTIASALATVTYNSVEGYSAVDPYRLQTLPDTYVMQPGEGYWINVPFDQTWIIDW